MSEASTLDDPERKTKLEEFYFQRKILFGCTLSLFFGLILWIIAISTNRWFIVSGGKTGIFVESHRRYFKASHTGINRNCRYAVVPQPVSTSVVRNFTTLSISSLDDLEEAKEKVKQEDYFKDFLKVDSPDIMSIESIDENFRKYLFAQWILNKDDKPEFAKLRNKLHSFMEKPHIKHKQMLDPTNYDQVKHTLNELITEVEVNKTHSLHVVVPNDLRFALFDDWEGKGLDLVHLLSNYAKSLRIDPSIYLKDTKFVFQPPPPIKKGFNGFRYVKWKRCAFHNLFADEDYLKSDPSVDEEMLDLSRSAATFAIITIFLMSLGFIFTVYTFLNPRYMFKRLAGGIHFIAGVTSATVCRILHVSVEYAREYLFYAFPAGAHYTYGFGFYFGILVSGINFFSFIMFLWYSRKKKGNKAATEELGMADEHIEIRR
ncbi:CLUMA_CG000652, isoform A [Clunio marinus]|uniref:CLUMA_CG000652, isoform A n=1 Tax=Clunio marinus TaxID=568069 RepID=A0A1J1HFS4_9DIPT|nr:CLUMA_CG000652, isoform A [Clunio marinus]